MGVVRDRFCDCGKAFRGAHLRCPACRSTERVCDCGRSFRGHSRKCIECYRADRVCECGRTYFGADLKCYRCRQSPRDCETCSKSFRGNYRKCPACRRTERQCVSCGNTFLDTESRCKACQVQDRKCPCGKSFRSLNAECSACQRAKLSPEERSALDTARRNRRRARKQNAEVDGPVPASTYRAIRDSGPCVYCGDTAGTVDHVVPLARGGWEHPDNLVAACLPCNVSKGRKLLTEWDPVRVKRAASVSAKVRDALALAQGRATQPATDLPGYPAL